jgi:hypothetical protein
LLKISYFFLFSIFHFPPPPPPSLARRESIFNLKVLSLITLTPGLVAQPTWQDTSNDICDQREKSHQASLF